MPLRDGWLRPCLPGSAQPGPRPNVHWAPDYNKSKRVDLNTLTKEEVASWKPGQTLLLNGKMLTGRDAAHKRIQDMLARAKLPWTSPTASFTTSAG